MVTEVEPPLQSMLPSTADAVNKTGSVIINEFEAEQLKKSITVTV